MDKPSYKLVGSSCGQHGQYTFFKAIRLSGNDMDRIYTIGDFFFIKIWQDSELVSIGELQLLWTDRVSDQTLVSLRLYFLPENTPDGRNGHGEHEVVALNEKVVVRADDLLSWMCRGDAWKVGLVAIPAPQHHTQNLHHTKIDMTDLDTDIKELDASNSSPVVVVFSYPRYCRYRAVLARLSSDPTCMADEALAAIGGFSTDSTNTRILYCKETFEYPELESHEFVCNHLAPRLAGRPRGRRRRPRSTDSDNELQFRHNSSDSDVECKPRQIDVTPGAAPSSEEEQFMERLRSHYTDIGADFNAAAKLTEVSLYELWRGVCALGGGGSRAGGRLWRGVAARLTPPAHTHAPHSPHTLRRIYDTYLLSFERATCPSPEIRESILLDSPPLSLDIETGETQPMRALDQTPVEPSPPKRERKEDIKISVKPVEQLLDTKIVNEFKNEIKIPRDLKIEPKPEPAFHRSILEIPKIQREMPRTNLLSLPRQLPQIPRELPQMPRELPQMPRELPKSPREMPKLPWDLPKLPREVTITPWEPPKPKYEPPRPAFEMGNNFLNINNSDAIKSFTEMNNVLIKELANKYGLKESGHVLEEILKFGPNERNHMFLVELSQRLNLVCPVKRDVVTVNNGHHPRTNQQRNVRSSLRNVRVKPPRTPHRPAPHVVATPSPPKPPPITIDDDVIEVPYKPCSPEVCEVETYQPPFLQLPFYSTPVMASPPVPPRLSVPVVSVWCGVSSPVRPVYGDPSSPHPPAPHTLHGLLSAAPRAPRTNLLDLSSNTHNSTHK